MVRLHPSPQELVEFTHMDINDFDIEAELKKAGISLEVYEPYKQLLGNRSRLNYLQKPLPQADIDSILEYERKFPEIKTLAEKHSEAVRSFRERNK